MHHQLPRQTCSCKYTYTLHAHLICSYMCTYRLHAYLLCMLYMCICKWISTTLATWPNINIDIHFRYGSIKKSEVSLYFNTRASLSLLWPHETYLQLLQLRMYVCTTSLPWIEVLLNHFGPVHQGICTTFLGLGNLQVGVRLGWERESKACVIGESFTACGHSWQCMHPCLSTVHHSESATTKVYKRK